MEIDITNNSNLYRYSEKSIKNKNYKLWEDIISYINQDIPFKEKFYLYENCLLEIPVCYCGNKVKFINMKSGYHEFCSRQCMYDSDKVKNKKMLTNIEKYGVSNPSKSEIVKEKVRSTNLSKFGFEYPLQSAEILDKLKNTNNIRYGVDNPSKLKYVRNKAQNTMLRKYGVRHAMHSNDIKINTKKLFLGKYGVDNPFKLSDIRDKIKHTMIKKYGSEYALQNKSLLDKSIKTNLFRYGEKSFTKTKLYKEIIIQNITNKNIIMVNDEFSKLIYCNKSEYNIQCSVCKNTFTIQRQLWRVRKKNNEKVCLICNPIFNNVSRCEKIILDYIKSIYIGNIVENFKINRREIDIYLPDIKIGFEYNGLYWHSELNKNKIYHYNKLKFFNYFQINLINIWEDDWQYKQDIVKSIILNKLGKSEKIFARKCQIRIPDNKSCRDFLNKNHIQGFIGSKVKIGLYYNNELVSLMTFGNLRKSLGQISKDESWELLRFCSKLNTTVVGGASKLFKYFLNNYKVNDIISYSDNSRSNGNLYNKLGFNFLKENKYNYYWYKDGVRYHRFNFRKDKLVKFGYSSDKTESEIMNMNGYYKIFDCGSKKWIFIL